MRRVLAAVATIAGVLLLAVPPAVAQYGGGGTTTTPPHPDTAHNPRGHMTADDTTVEPGQQATGSVPAGSCQAGETQDVDFARREPGAPAETLGSTTTQPDGSFTFTVTIPSTAEGGTYVLYVTCTAPDGQSCTMFITIVVQPTAAQAQGENSASVQSDSRDAGAVPPVIKQLQDATGRGRSAPASGVVTGRQLLDLGAAHTASGGTSDDAGVRLAFGTAALLLVAGGVLVRHRMTAGGAAR